MGSLALPAKLSVSLANEALCDRIGVRIDGVDMGKRVLSYDVAEGIARLTNGDVVHGTIQPYWRPR
jgi:hypothetical protein